MLWQTAGEPLVGALDHPVTKDRQHQPVLALFKLSVQSFLHQSTNQGSDGDMHEAKGMFGEEKGEGEKSQKGGQQDDSFPFLRSQFC